jgi:1-pyrroline-4-hydroxy-2-carboxylate deaminase
MSDTGINLDGVIVAAALPFRADAAEPSGLAVDYERYARHCDRLVRAGCLGVGPNGSLGEYSSLEASERRRVVQVAVEAVGGRGPVIAGAHGVGWHQAAHWARCARDDGADGVLVLPPTMYRASDAEVLEHYRRVAEVGLPIIAYNNPHDTRVDLTPSLVARLSEIPEVVAVKEFSGDVARVGEILERCSISVLVGSDDLLYDSVPSGATGWFAGFPNAFPELSVEFFELLGVKRWEEAAEINDQVLALYRWDARTEFVQAIKLAMDLTGEAYGGPTRPPRGPLDADVEGRVRADVQRVLDFLLSRATPRG